jgi:hypothetical protein
MEDVLRFETWGDYTSAVRITPRILDASQENLIAPLLLKRFHVSPGKVMAV